MLKENPGKASRKSGELLFKSTLNKLEKKGLAATRQRNDWWLKTFAQYFYKLNLTIQLVCIVKW